jgi:hypothetical protein
LDHSEFENLHFFGNSLVIVQTIFLMEPSLPKSHQ